MRFYGILFVLCLTYATSSALSLSSISSAISSFFNSAQTNIQNALCSYFQKHPERVAIATNKLDQLVQKYSQAQQKFNATLVYLNSASTQQNLVAGSTTCSNALTNLYNILVTDLKNAGQNQADALNIFNSINNNN